jgi:hypothetical protein
MRLASLSRRLRSGNHPRPPLRTPPPAARPVRDAAWLGLLALLLRLFAPLVRGPGHPRATSTSTDGAERRVRGRARIAPLWNPYIPSANHSSATNNQILYPLTGPPRLAPWRTYTFVLAHFASTRRPARRPPAQADEAGAFVARPSGCCRAARVARRRVEPHLAGTAWRPGPSFGDRSLRRGGRDVFLWAAMVPPVFGGRRVGGHGGRALLSPPPSVSTGGPRFRRQPPPRAHGSGRLPLWPSPLGRPWRPRAGRPQRRAIWGEG